MFGFLAVVASAAPVSAEKDPGDRTGKNAAIAPETWSKQFWRAEKYSDNTAKHSAGSVAA